MLYESTRGNHSPLSSAKAIKLGISPDGGLFVPKERLTISLNEILHMTKMSYQDQAIKILQMFLSDYSGEEIKMCVQGAYNENSFDHPDIAPLVNIDKQLSISELWHGPTCAFKDIALQLLPRLLVKAMEKTGEPSDILILVATSGDTGKAALEGFRDVPHTAIVVFFPEQGVSEVQKIQMVSQKGENVSVIAVQGNFDEAQSGVKEIFGDTSMSDAIGKYGYIFSSANSINWGRLVPQIIYYFFTYTDLLSQGKIKLGEAINFVVPTGNFGNILAGFYAREMGLPINRLICAANENNVLTDFINTGTYNRNRDFKRTISPSMDILISSNLERLLFELTEHNTNQIRTWMSDLKEVGSYTIDKNTFEKVQKIFWSDYANDLDTMNSIKEIHRQYSYVVDTHTAVGLHVYEKYQKATGDKRQTVVLSTASPFKFNASVVQALIGAEKTAEKNDFDLMHILADISGLTIPKGLRNLNSQPFLHKSVVNRANMKNEVLKFVANKSNKKIAPIQFP